MQAVIYFSIIFLVGQKDADSSTSGILQFSLRRCPSGCVQSCTSPGMAFRPPCCHPSSSYIIFSVTQRFPVFHFIRQFLMLLVHPRKPSLLAVSSQLCNRYSLPFDCATFSVFQPFTRILLYLLHLIFRTTCNFCQTGRHFPHKNLFYFLVQYVTFEIIPPLDTVYFFFISSTFLFNLLCALFFTVLVSHVTVFALSCIVQ